MIETVQPLRLAEDELASVESFRRQNNTAVLTIMFTDIVGFTRLTDEKGEHHSNEVRRQHDALLESVITEGGAGVVVKHIGDAVMAVFSEPSTAVERALRIHDGLVRLARERADLGPIQVKIGLDMGQVTVEDNVDADVFGRHVNRASRVQTLADGGQVFMTYTVFDSAQAWLGTPGNEGLEWASHGRYRLKGISTPVEIFEVTDPDRSPLRPPSEGQRVRSIPGLAWAAGLVLLGAAAAIGLGRFQSTGLWLAQYAPPLSYLDGVELRLGGDPGDGEREVLLDVSPGRHVLHYDVADAVRYYAVLDLERGMNHMRPEFVESRLPTLYRHRVLGEERVEAAREGAYHFYDAEGNRIDRSARLYLAVHVAAVADAPDSMRVSLEWGLELDGTEVNRVAHAIIRPADAIEPLRDEFGIYADEHHRYAVRLRVDRRSAHLEILAAFLPPPAMVRIGARDRGGYGRGEGPARGMMRSATAGSGWRPPRPSSRPGSSRP